MTRHRSVEDDLARLRAFRVGAGRDLSLRDDMTEQARALTRQQRAVGGVAEAWAAVVPPRLAERTELSGVARGVLRVRTADAATRFELDRFLRSGGEAALARANASVLRVKLV